MGNRDATERVVVAVACQCFVGGGGGGHGLFVGDGNIAINTAVVFLYAIQKMPSEFGA